MEKIVTVANAALIALAAAPAYAFGSGNLGNAANPVVVPEISALEGTAAIAVVATVVLLAWERRRRAQ